MTMTDRNSTHVFEEDENEMDRENQHLFKINIRICRFSGLVLYFSFFSVFNFCIFAFLHNCVFAYLRICIYFRIVTLFPNFKPFVKIIKACYGGGECVSIL